MVKTYFFTNVDEQIGALTASSVGTETELSTTTITPESKTGQFGQNYLFSTGGGGASGEPGLNDWPNGDYTWYLDVTTANSALELDTIDLYRLSSDGNTIVASKSTNVSRVLGTVQVESGTISWNDGTQNPGGRASTDRFAIKYTFQNVSHGNNTITFQIGGAGDSRVDVPMGTSTTLYLHAATDPTSGLPSTEQSSLTADDNIGAQSTNRTMTTTIGSSQTSIADTLITTAIEDHYFTKFVSPSLDMTTIPASAWIYNFSSQQSNASADFPINSQLGTNFIWVNCYVWRPSNSSKIGTIHDGRVLEDVIPTSFGTNQVAITVSFNGSSVGSISTGDVLILEVWFGVRSASGTHTGTFYYDGTTENRTHGATVSNHASFIEGNGIELIFGAAGTTFQRPVSDTITLTESNTRPLVARAKSDTITLSDSLNRVGTFQRTRSDTTSLSDTVSAAIIRLRTASDTTNLSDTTQRTLEAVRTATDNTISDETLQRLATLIRTSSDTTTVNDTVAKFLVFSKQVSDSIILSDTVQKLKTFFTAVSDTTTINDQINRVPTYVRTLADTTNLSDSVSRLATFIRNLLDSTVLSEVVDKIKNPGEGTTYQRPVSDTITLTEELLRSLTVLRTLQDTTSLSDTLQRLLTAVRTSSDNISLSDTVQRLLTALRTSSDNVILSDTVQRVLTAVRTSSDSITLSDTVQRLLTALRTAQDTISLSESLNRILQALRQVQDNLGAAPPPLFIYHHYFADIIPTSESVQGIFIQGALFFDRLRSSLSFGFGRPT